MSCGCSSTNYAKLQNAKYDKKNNKILYGVSNNMKAFGVGNGTCNLVNPSIYTNKYKCGYGVGGGNPCRKNIPKTNTKNKVDNVDKVEKFENINNAGIDITSNINIILIFLLIYLLYSSF